MNERKGGLEREEEVEGNGEGKRKRGVRVRTSKVLEHENKLNELNILIVCIPNLSLKWNKFDDKQMGVFPKKC